MYILPQDWGIKIIYSEKRCVPPPPAPSYLLEEMTPKKLEFSQKLEFSSSWRKTRLRPWHTQRRTDSQRWSLSLVKDLQLVTDLARGIGAGTLVSRAHTLKALLS